MELFKHPENYQGTLAALRFLTQQLAPVSNVVGIELLNEPFPDSSLEGFCAYTLIGFELCR
jgi:hypothetical protein